jgi:hypothetical protein
MIPESVSWANYFFREGPIVEEVTGKQQHTQGNNKSDQQPTTPWATAQLDTVYTRKFRVKSINAPQKIVKRINIAQKNVKRINGSK